MAQFKVYSFATQDRSGRVRWMLEELGLSYESQFLDGEKKENLSPEILKLSPTGRIPILLEGDKVLLESAAICLYLADRYPEKELAPPMKCPYRPAYLQWSVAAVSTFEQAFFDYARSKEKSEQEREEALSDLLRLGQFTSDTISNSKSGFIVGDKFSTADLLVGSSLGWSKGLLLEKFPVLREYREALKDRPACIRSKIFAPFET